MKPLFHFVNKTVVYFFHQLDFLVVKANVDELSYTQRCFGIKITHPWSVHRFYIVNNDKPENSPDYITG
jgi:hypothetical protein